MGEFLTPGLLLLLRSSGALTPKNLGEPLGFPWNVQAVC